jgi:hypothetical protein
MQVQPSRLYRPIRIAGIRYDARLAPWLSILRHVVFQNDGLLEMIALVEELHERRPISTGAVSPKTIGCDSLKPG